MSFKLSDKQRELLSVAAEREGRLLPTPPHLKVGEGGSLRRSSLQRGWPRKSKQRLGLAYMRLYEGQVRNDWE